MGLNENRYETLDLRAIGKDETELKILTYEMDHEVSEVFVGVGHAFMML